MANTAISGANYFIEADGISVGWATGVNFQETVQHVPISVLGNIDVEEHTPTQRTASLSVAHVHILKKTLADMGFWPRGETADVVEFPAKTLVLKNTATNEVEFALRGVRAQSRNMSLQKGGILTGSATFYVIRLDDHTQG
jgi:hypothetical protein